MATTSSAGRSGSPRCRGRPAKSLNGLRALTGVLAIALAAEACATVPKQHSPVPIEIGQRVRVTLASRVATGRLQGTVLSISPDTIAVEREEGGERRLSRTQVDEVEVSVSRIVEPVKAAGYGLLAAAPLLVPMIILIPLVVPEYAGAAFGLLVGPVAAAAAVGALMGSGPQDVWVDGIWASDSIPVPPDSLPESPG